MKTMPPEVRLRAVYEAIYQGYLRDGLPPALRAIALAAGLRSSGHAQILVRRLARSGLVRLVRGHPVPTDVLRVPPRCPTHQVVLRLRAEDGRPPRLLWSCPICGRHGGERHGVQSRR